MLMCAAAGLPGSCGWRRPHSPRHMGECVHDASAGEWYPDELTQMTRHTMQAARESHELFWLVVVQCLIMLFKG